VKAYISRLLLSALAVFALPAILDRQGVAGQRPAILSFRQVLESYSEGEFENSLAVLRQLGTAQMLYAGLRKDAQAWIDEGAAHDRDFRQRVSAVVALEAAHLAFGDTTARSFGQREDVGRRIIELGCQWVRSRTARTEFDHVWMLASIALIHSVQNIDQTASFDDFKAREFLDNPSRNVMRVYAVPMRMQRLDAEHREHAKDRVPDEPRFRLADVLAHGTARRMPNRPGTTAYFMARGYGDEADSAHALEPTAKRFVQEAVAAFAPLVTMAPIAEESRLRRAILLFHIGDFQQSLRDLEVAFKSDDTAVAYLAHLYAGLGLDQLNRREQAIAQFRAALVIVPNARSAAFAEAADLFLSGDRQGAARLVNTTLAVPPVSDPWRTFSLADYRFWPGYLQRLRATLTA
jgi:tetratricopeptide (TPR) repeat protein